MTNRLVQGEEGWNWENNPSVLLRSTAPFTQGSLFYCIGICVFNREQYLTFRILSGRDKGEAARFFFISLENFSEILSVTD